jgi:hypothetical protein
MVSMLSPWQIYANATKALFDGDPDVTVTLDDGDTPKLVIRVHGSDKAASLAELLPEELQFGNVTLAIAVIPDNDCELTVADHIRRAFAGNPLFLDVMEVPLSPQELGATYALFMPSCVQYYTDTLMSPYGATTKTVEEVADEVLELPDGVFASSAEL